MLEVCVDSIESALNAAAGGAGRLELCSALSEGGLTPTVGTLTVLKQQLTIPIFVMIRPRRGNDFQYTDLELDSMVHDIKQFVDAGADGFVFGALDASGNVDVAANKRLVAATADKQATFHRAFDVTDPEEKLETAKLLRELGFSRILTSGFQTTAEDGLEVIRELIDAQIGIQIMPGAGVCSANLALLMTETGCKELHTSARVAKKTTNEVSRKISMGGGTDDLQPLFVCSEAAVRELVNIAKRIK